MRTPPPPVTPASRPSYSASSCRSLLREQPAEAGMRPRQLRLGKAHRPLQPLNDPLLRVTLDVMQPDHGTRRRRQSLERALEIDAGGYSSHPESLSPLRVL